MNGIYRKFRVERTDGRSAPGEKHDGCTYFVLDIDHDPHALPALKAYDSSCKKTHPDLAYDLLKAVGSHGQGFFSAADSLGIKIEMRGVPSPESSEGEA